MKEKRRENSSSLLTKLAYPAHAKRFLFFIISDLLIIIFSLYSAFFIRFEFRMPAEYRLIFFKTVSFFILIKITVFASFRLYKITWRYVGLYDMLNIISALIISESVLMTFVLNRLPSFFHAYIPSFLLSFDPYLVKIPRSILFIDWFISFFLFCGLRISKRLFFEVIRKRKISKIGKRTIIIGAGNTGEMILRDMARLGFCNYYPVGFLDDDKNKIGMYVRGLKVFGTIDQLKSVILKYEIEAAIIAIPSLNYKVLREIYDSAKKSKVNTIKIVPRIYDSQKPDIKIKSLEDIRIEDLIGRQTVDIDYEEIKGFLKGKVVLVIGAGGSIGSEITTQVCAFQPGKVILFDIDETELHNMKLKLEKVFPDLFMEQTERGNKQKQRQFSEYQQRKNKIVFVTGDIRDEDAINEVFRVFEPQIVFHAAACKHVPMMEYNPKEAVKVNMFGTYRVAKASADHNVERFIMISTDKAVRPTSIMGATKRMAEYICKAFDDCSGTTFTSVRFGNVLGSRGSVLPTFLEQLKYGGPLTVTHKDMQRYFMTIPEAVSLVLQSSVIGKGGDVLVLDMGEPVKIVTLAEELIRIHGMQPYKDINIEFVGSRPGEKLFEEILTAEEGTTASKHEKIFVAKNGVRYSKDEIERILKEFEVLLKSLSIEENWKIKGMLKKYVKYYEGDEGVRQMPLSPVRTYSTIGN